MEIQTTVKADKEEIKKLKTESLFNHGGFAEDLNKLLTEAF
ncbi:MAG TPA: hypothetical protein VK982_10505 [Bacteroidales bacterium]|nr:hypothetical protein [Bacteroidales bacterium]